MDDDSQTRAQLLDDIAALRQQLVALRTARLDAESVIETVRVPLVVLTADLYVISAHRACYHTFQVTPEETQNKLLYDVGNGQRTLLVLSHVCYRKARSSGWPISLCS